MTDMIRASGLVKRYGQVTALDGLDLVVPEGTVMGLLGPNGAGKTTTVRVLTTLLEHDEGKATVTGLDVVAALVAKPQVLFLDEPTTGLDPRSRLGMWDVISELVAGGTTLLLTTQYLEEADQLADEIVVIDRGRVIAKGTADELKAQVGGERVEVVVQTAAELSPARDALSTLATGEVLVEDHVRRLTAPV